MTASQPLTTVLSVSLSRAKTEQKPICVAHVSDFGIFDVCRVANRKSLDAPHTTRIPAVGYPSFGRHALEHLPLLFGSGAGDPSRITFARSVRRRPSRQPRLTHAASLRLSLSLCSLLLCLSCTIYPCSLWESVCFHLVFCTADPCTGNEDRVGGATSTRRCRTGLPHAPMESQRAQQPPRRSPQADAPARHRRMPSAAYALRM